MAQKNSEIVVIGGGVAGIVAAYLLQRRYQVTLIEAAPHLGGHTRTIAAELEGGVVPVDIGFIVHNNQTYPLFRKFIDQLGIESVATDMSFAYSRQEPDLEYAGTSFMGLFAQNRNLFSPPFWKMLLGIRRFCSVGHRALQDGSAAGLSLEQFLAEHHISEATTEQYILPMGAAIWSTPTAQMRDYPADAFLAFFDNHGLLNLTNRPTWLTIRGGCDRYVQAFRETFKGDIRTGSPVRQVRRDDRGVSVDLASGETLSFDKAVIATHADQALKLLAEPTADERKWLGAWRYTDNRVVLHSDHHLLPRRKSAWGAWNYLHRNARENLPPALSYYMNRLQPLPTDEPVIVSLNLRDEIHPHKVHHEEHFTHPYYDATSLASQQHLPNLNGQNRTWFCGSYFGYGFHEDAVRAAVEVGQSLGVNL
jgi:predicted NAD/FAD-binding protein